ncbi:MAG: hypothetical protein Q9227_004750 [Pyrenula ochraceoflavens]
MLNPRLVLSLLVFIISYVSATALTYKLPANEKACFFTYVDSHPSKVAFYFAVQSGGSFDVDYSVVGPNDRIILDGEKERQADYVFTANDVGEYRFCFNNDMSTFAEKMIDFEIAVENEAKTSLPQKQGTSPEHTSQLEDSIFKLSGQVSTINRMQKYFRTRENRNFSTVQSTEKRIFQFSLIEVVMMVGMAGLQVFIVRFFFQGARKALALVSRANVTSIALSASNAPPEDQQVVDAAFQSYSIEFNYMHPNLFSSRLLQNLADISGAYPIIRVGGSTQNRAVYYSNQTYALNETFTSPYDDQPSALTIGPKWFESFQQFPKGTQYIYGLNFYDGDYGLNQTVSEAVPAYQTIADALYGFEIGNEVDGLFSSLKAMQPTNVRSPQAGQEAPFANAIRDAVKTSTQNASAMPEFQGCAFEAPRAGNLKNGTTWNVANAVRDGMAKNGMLRTVADHDADQQL